MWQSGGTMKLPNECFGSSSGNAGMPLSSSSMFLKLPAGVSRRSFDKLPERHAGRSPSLPLPGRPLSLHLLDLPYGLYTDQRPIKPAFSIFLVRSRSTALTRDIEQPHRRAISGMSRPSA